MDRAVISNNILVLTTDMGNLRGLGQKAALVSNTETVGLNILSLPCTVPAIELLLSAS